MTCYTTGMANSFERASPEAYQALEGQLEEARAQGSDRVVLKPGRFMNIVTTIEGADQRLKEMRNAGNAEALALEAKHEELKQNLDQALQALESFERRELSMGPKSTAEHIAKSDNPESP